MLLTIQDSFCIFFSVLVQFLFVSSFEGLSYINYLVNSVTRSRLSSKTLSRKQTKKRWLCLGFLYRNVELSGEVLPILVRTGSGYVHGFQSAPRKECDQSSAKRVVRKGFGVVDTCFDYEAAILTGQGLG